MFIDAILAAVDAAAAAVTLAAESFAFHLVFFTTTRPFFDSPH